MRAAPASDVLVAVGELCTNSIVHAYDGAPGGPIRVSVRGFDDRVEVMVEDVGDAFDPAHDTPPRLPGAPGDDSALRERGVVLYLVRQLVDRLQTDPARAKGNGWTLVKYLPGFAPPRTS